MDHLSPFCRFARDESGSATIDWAILSLVLLGTGSFVVDEIGNVTHGLASDLSARLGGIEIPMSFDDYRNLR